MEDQREEESGLLNAFLPKGILEYFTITKVDQLERSINIFLEEKNIVPAEYVSDKLTSKGFYNEIKVQDLGSDKLVNFL